MTEGSTECRIAPEAEDAMQTIRIFTVLIIIWAALFHHDDTAIGGSPDPSEQELKKLLESFADAWNRHDVNALMSMMTEDGVFEASAGTEVNGQRYEGQKAVRAAYEAVFAQFPDARWNNPRHLVKGNRGVSEWTFTGTSKDGRRVEVTGCDLFTFREGKIAVKNSYRKNRTPLR